MRLVRMTRLVQWDRLELRVDPEKLAGIAASLPLDPIERLRIVAGDGILRVEGILRQFVSVPFSLEFAGITGAAHALRLPVRRATAFGAIPIPRLLFSLMQSKLPRGLVAFEEPATFVVSLDRFLPNFVDVEIERVQIATSGLLVTLGGGGADVPAQEDRKNG